jgi:uncharacterized membrane protein (DUF373 family)
MYEMYSKEVFKYLNFFVMILMFIFIIGMSQS